MWMHQITFGRDCYNKYAFDTGFRLVIPIDENTKGTVKGNKFNHKSTKDKKTHHSYDNSTLPQNFSKSTIYSNTLTNTLQNIIVMRWFSLLFICMLRQTQQLAKCILKGLPRDRKGIGFGNFLVVVRQQQIIACHC